MRLKIPFDRLTIVTALDAGIVVKRPQALEMRKNPARTLGRLGLAQRERRIGRRNG